ncbi:hypothetical protein D3C78_993020 [compost metagenome]
MSLVALLGRFALAYLLLLFGIAIGLHLIGLQSNSGTNTAALLGAVMWACLAFAKKNGRYLSNSEQRATFLGMLIVDLLLQSSIILLVSTTSTLSFGAVLLTLALVGGLHALAIWLMIGVAGRQYAKEAAQAQRNLGASHLDGKSPVRLHGGRGGSGFHPAQPNLSAETER